MPSAGTTIFVFGASGDLALNKTFPSLFELYLAALLPPATLIVGYARSALSDADARERWGTNLKHGTPEQRAAFLAQCIYRHGAYDSAEAFGKVRYHSCRA
jgi:glucose-6-phosphate 1-dehydrogenase